MWSVFILKGKKGVTMVFTGVSMAHMILLSFFVKAFISSIIFNLFSDLSNLFKFSFYMRIFGRLSVLQERRQGCQ